MSATDHIEPCDASVDLLAPPFARGANYLQFALSSAFPWSTLVFMRVAGVTATLVDVRDVARETAQWILEFMRSSRLTRQGPDAGERESHGGLIDLAVDVIESDRITLVHVATNSLARAIAPICTDGWLNVTLDRNPSGIGRREVIRPGLISLPPSKSNRR